MRRRGRRRAHFTINKIMPGGFLSETEVFRNCVKQPVYLQHNDLLQIDDNGEQHI